MMFVSSLSKSSGMVNAAFLLEVKESNPTVWENLHALRAIAGEQVSELAGVSTNDFVRQLDELLDGIATEFSLEESLGFIGGIAVCEASRESDLARSASLHREIYVRLQEVCERAEELQYRGTIIRDLAGLQADFLEFDQQLRKHEEFEAELIRSQLGRDAL